MSISISIRYLGAFKEKTGKAEESFAVSQNISEAYKEIMSYLENQHGIGPPLTLLIGETHIIRALKNPDMYPVKEGTYFVVIPIISGG